MSTYIVKMQMPIVSNHDEPEVLIYNEDRSIMQQFPLTEDIREMMGDDEKRYFYAHTGLDGYLHLDRQAPDQDW